jgi:Glycosyl transferases group 1/DUF based on E. rectale Gene description (DUF3880)
MNIFLVSNYGRGTLSSLVKRGFEQGGHHVTAVSPDQVSGDWLPCDPRAHLPTLVEESPLKPDLVVLVETDPRSRFFPGGLLEVPVPTAFWAVDNHLNYRWHKEYSQQFDVTFFAQKDYIRAARRYGAGDVHWLPLAADAEYHRIEPHPSKYAVSFVGNMNPGRQKFFDSIDRDIPLNVVSGVYGQEMAAILAESRIGLNVSLREDLNMRFFEVLASGAMLVTQKIDAGMNELFQDGTHFVTHNIGDASSVIRRYLENEPLRAAIARRGREVCLSRHTYRHRCAELLRVALSDADFAAKREQKRRSYRPDIAQALVFGHPTFKMREEARQSYREAVQKSRLGTYLHTAKYAGAYVKEAVEKKFKKTIW